MKDPFITSFGKSASVQSNASRVMECPALTHHRRNLEYSPTLQRWMQQDPIGYVDGSNPYESIKDNPVDGLDPKGFATISDVAEGLVDFTAWTVFPGPVVMGLLSMGGCAKASAPAKSSGTWSVTPDAKVPIKSTAQQLLLGGATEYPGYDVEFKPDPAHIIAGTKIFLVQAITSPEFGSTTHYDLTNTSTSEIAPPPAGTFPPGYTDDGGMPWAGHDGYQDALYVDVNTPFVGHTWTVEVGAIAQDPAIGGGKAISFVQFTFDNAKRTLSPITTSATPGATWIAAENQWAHMHLPVYNH